MRRAIYEDDVIKLLDKGWKSGVYPVASNIHALPSAQPDTRSLEQIKWERDIAIQQLKDLGYSLGEKMRTGEDTISRQVAIDAMCELMHHWYGGDPKDEIREIKRELEKLPSTQPDYTAIKYEIQRNIDDFYNSKHHAQHVSNNGRMIAFGLELALDIVKDVERKNDG